MELEGRNGQDASTFSESEGYIADDETRPGATAPDNHVHGGARTHSLGEGADKPTTIEKMKEKFWQAENHMKGKEPSAVEDPHPELAYIAPMPQDEKSGYFSRMGHKHGGQHHETRNADVDMEFSQGEQPAPEVQAANKGVGSSELGTGYEEDVEETINPAIVPKYDEGVKPPPGMLGADEGFGNSEVGTGYEGGSEGSFSHTRHFLGFSSKEAQVEDMQTASESDAISEDETDKKPGYFTGVLGGKKHES